MWKKYLSLVLLTTQSSLHILSLSYVRSRNTDSMFFSSTAIVMSELLKVTTCLLVILYQEGSVVKWLGYLHRNIILQPLDCAKIAVPSLLYTLQNNLLYLALSNLEAATFQVYYQMKILTTALFSVLILRKTLSRIQWIALVILSLGVALVKISANEDTPSPEQTQSQLKGILAVAVSCVLSGFAGVYFEKILKGTQQSVILRNVQLGGIGVLIAYLTMEVKEGPIIHDKGFFYGYDILVWSVISLQALGGLIVALVVKYADNILKGFATSIAIISSSVLSVFLFDFHITLDFSIGASLVILSVFLYCIQQRFKCYQCFKSKEVHLKLSSSLLDFIKYSLTNNTCF